MKLRALLSVGFLANLLSLPGFVHSQSEDQPRTGRVAVNEATPLFRKPDQASGTAIAIAPGTILKWIEGEEKNGFYRVLVPKGPIGWVPVERATVRADVPPTLMGMFAAKPPCKTSLAQCPAQGCEKPGSAHALVNTTKRRPPKGKDPVLLDHEDFSALQDQAQSLVGQGEELEKADRDLLQGLKVKRGTVFEGQLVSMVGFIAIDRELRPGGAESVNCRLTGASNTDVHVPIVARASHTEYESVVVEPIPQGRPAGWTVDRMKAVQRAKSKVMIVGALFYDNLHVVNGDSDNPVGSQPKRLSIWEIHPVTRFFVCQKPKNACDAERASDWVPLQAYNPS